MQDARSPSAIDPANEKPKQANPETSVAKPARAPSYRRERVALALVAGALLASGGYYAWQTWFSGESSASPVLTAVATRANLDQLSQLRLARLQAAVGLFKALGGGWSDPDRALPG